MIENKKMWQILDYAIDNESSDIHITQNLEGWVRTDGRLERCGVVTTLSDLDEFIGEIIPAIFNKYKRLRDKAEIIPIDYAFEYKKRRFRVNIYLGFDGINMAIRLLNDEILSLSELNMPEQVWETSNIRTGMYIVAGTTGSGKSTTLASIIDDINHKRCENIITVEQPIEYIYKSYRSRIEQIEVGTHIGNFADATVAVMRQNPNVILIGEMRDLTTIQNAITLAETGHAVYATLHAKSVTEAIDRIIDVFPPESQEQIRIELAGVLKGIIHQTLVIGKNNKLVPLIEQLSVDGTVSAMIRNKQKSNSIRDYARGMTQMGNVHITDNAAWHILSGRLTLEDVKPYLSNDDFEVVRTIAEKKQSWGEFGG